MSYLQINGDQWVFSESQATPFMCKRVAMLVKTGYLRLVNATDLYKVYRVAGSKKDYIQAMDNLMDGKS